MKRAILACLIALLPANFARSADDIVLADFDGDGFGNWQARGGAFGPGPTGKIFNRFKVDGFAGNGFANSRRNGDAATGTLTSPAFTIERPFIKFLIGGGSLSGKTCFNLQVDGKIVRTAAGSQLTAGNMDVLEPRMWDVREFMGKQAVLEAVDLADGAWGRVYVDQVVQSDTPTAKLVNNATRQIIAERRYLLLPIKKDGINRRLTLIVDGRPEPNISLQLADGRPDWWAFRDISALRGKQITLRVDKLPEGSRALSLIEQSDQIKDADRLYKEPLRPQFHFSSRRGRLNDPNGMVFYKGEYHLFFQHSPYGWTGGNQHWGHAVSRDMVRWTELEDALYPDEMGVAASGSGLVDWDNVSGLGEAGRPPLLLFYTAFNLPRTQCLAYSLDGRTFTKFANNPVLKSISPENRDPKVFWHEPTRRWVMALYVEHPELEKKGRQRGDETVEFLSSPDLKEWTVMSYVPGFHECPDFFELPVDGDPKHKKWLLTGGDSDYMIGTFDGTTFTPETPRIRGNFGSCLYATQTFNDMPDGRRVRMSWLRAASPGMPFNQAMSLPTEIRLVSTPEGPRATWTPVEELKTLRGKSHLIGATVLKPSGANPLADIRGELLEIRATLTPGKAKTLALNARGASVVYDAPNGELVVNEARAKVPLRNGSLHIAVYVDRTSVEVFADGGLVYMPVAFIPKAGDASVSVSAAGGEAKVESMEIYELKSAWE